MISENVAPVQFRTAGTYDILHMGALQVVSGRGYIGTLDAGGKVSFPVYMKILHDPLHRESAGAHTSKLGVGLTLAQMRRTPVQSAGIRAGRSIKLRKLRWTVKCRLLFELRFLYHAY